MCLTSWAMLLVIICSKRDFSENINCLDKHTTPNVRQDIELPALDLFPDANWRFPGQATGSWSRSHVALD